MSAAARSPRERLPIPARGHTEREECLHFRREVQPPGVEGVEQRLDAEPIPRGEEHLVRLVPQENRELPAQLRQAGRTEVLVEVKGDLAVRAGAQPVARRLQLSLYPLVVVELAVDDDVQPAVFTLDRLVPRLEVDDGQARVPQTDPPVRSDPDLLSVRTAVDQAPRGALERAARDRLIRRKNSDDSAHGPSRERRGRLSALSRNPE